MMKVVKFCVPLFFLIQCKTVELNKKIQYVLPYEVEMRLLEQLRKDRERPIIFFSLRKDGEAYKITLVQCDKEELKRIDKFNMVSSSCRFLLIGKKFYPLLFETDYQFGTKLKKKAIETGTQNRWTDALFGIPRSHPIYDGAYTLAFKTNGELL